MPILLAQPCSGRHHQTGTTATLTVRGTFAAGATQITLKQDGHANAVWDSPM
jgi:hypothetical protein